jgi:F0F1-type ATP synthase epsilon subunit
MSSKAETPRDSASVLVNDKTDAKTVTFVKLTPKPGQLVVKMYTPYKTFYEGDAVSISALNDTGEFDVLAGHHNFITMLKPCTVMIQLPDKTKKEIPIARGLMHVRSDKVIVFLDV